MFPAIVDLVLLLEDRTLTIMNVVAHLVGTVLVEMDTVTEAHLDAAIMTKNVVVMVAHLHAVVPRLKTILRPVGVVASKILIAGTTHLLTHMPMAGPLTTDLQGTTLREILVTPIMIAVAATGNLSYLKQPPFPPTYINRSSGPVICSPVMATTGRLSIGRLN
jgi:hypothetical protein